MKIEEKIKQFAPEEQIEVKNFTTMSQECDWKCLKCGQEFKAIPNTIFHRHSKHICFNCFPPLRKREQQNRKDIQEMAMKNPNIKLLDIYVDKKLRVKFQCLNCGAIEDFRWSDRKKIECTHCSSSHRNCDKQSYQYLLSQKYDNKYEVLQFQDMSHKVLLKCKCGFSFTVLPISTLRARGIKCPKCNKTRSKGELFIENYLVKHRLFFEQEKHFNWLPQGWRYDFYLPDKNTIIEFHGEQHTKYTPYFHKTKEEWYKAQERDKIKLENALSHGINYLIIPFNYQLHLKEILDNFLSSTTIPKGSRGKCFEMQNFLNKEEDIV